MRNEKKKKICWIKSLNHIQWKSKMISGNSIHASLIEYAYVRARMRNRIIPYAPALTRSLVCSFTLLRAPAFIVIHACMHTHVVHSTYIPYGQHQKLESMLLHNFHCTNKVHLPLDRIGGVLSFYLLLLLLLRCVVWCGVVCLWLCTRFSLLFILFTSINFGRVTVMLSFHSLYIYIGISFIVLELRAKRMYCIWPLLSGHI